MKKVIVSRVDGTRLFEIEAGDRDRTVMEILSRNGWSASIPHRVFHVAECERERWFYTVSHGNWIGVPSMIGGHVVSQVHNGRFVVGQPGKPVSVSQRFLNNGMEMVAYGDDVTECRKLLRAVNYVVSKHSVLA